MRQTKWWLLTCFMLGGMVGPRPKPGCTRSHIHRSASARAQFRRMTGHRHGWPGHVDDHIYPLCACGLDAPSNMQWQRRDSSLVKDRWEVRLCQGKMTLEQYEDSVFPRYAKPR